jgi:hypothetical protein
VVGIRAFQSLAVIVMIDPRRIMARDLEAEHGLHGFVGRRPIMKYVAGAVGALVVLTVLSIMFRPELLFSIAWAWAGLLAWVK